jgi:Tol biopolymer transport system component
MVQNIKKKSNLLLAAFVFLMAVAFITASYFQSVQAAFPGVNGKIAFVSARDGNNEIYLMDVDGTSPIRLTNNPANDIAPAWSPDGTKIAFVSARDGNNEIYVMNADGSDQTNLTNNVASELAPAWSPDGTQITFHTNRDGNNEIYVMNADGSSQINITNAASDDAFANWSPDGTKIAFRSAGIVTINTDGTGRTTIANIGIGGGAEPNWSPDGSKIVFWTNAGSIANRQIYIVDPDGSNLAALTSSDPNNTNAAWSPDAIKITFATTRDGNAEVYIMDADGTNQVRLTNNSNSDTQPSIQPLITPTVTNDSSVTTTAGKPVTIDVLANDTDTYGSLDPSTVTITSAPLNGTTSINTTTGAITYTPNENFTGNDTFTYQVCSSYSSLCETATVSITVTPGLPKTGDGSTTSNTLWILAVLGIFTGLTAFGIKRTHT